MGETCLFEKLWLFKKIYKKKNPKKEIFVSTSEPVLWKEFVVDVTFQIVSCTVWNKQVCAMCK